MRTLTIGLTEELHAQAEHVAQEQGTSVEELVRGILAEQLPLLEEQTRVRRIVESQRRARARSYSLEEMRAYLEEMEQNGQLIE
jgi:hypothetical protein